MSQSVPAIPGPPALPLVGHLPEFLNDRIGFLTRCAAQYGEVVKLRIGTPTFLLTNLDDIKYVLVTNPANYTKTLRIAGKSAQHHLGAGLLTRSGPTHLKQRRMMQPIFHRKIMEGFVATIVAAIDEHTAGWKSGQTLEIAHEMKTLGQKVMLKALLGDDANRETGALQKAVRARRSYYEHLLGSSLPFPEYHPVPVSFRYASAIRLLDQTIYQAIQSRRASGAQSNDLLSEFIRASYDDGTTMTDKQIRDEALTFMDTGYETLSSALAWAWYLLAQQPQIQSKLSTELQENLENRPVTANDLPRLGYAEMVLNETLRLFPPTWMFVRVAQKEDKLPSGAVIPAKAKLFLSQYLAHRNPSYFPNPEHFDPERFGEAQESSRPKFAYFPFGGGAHICIGEPFARLECILVLATLGRRFNFELVTGQKIVPDPNLNLRPKHGIRLRLKEATRQSESR